MGHPDVVVGEARERLDSLWHKGRPRKDEVTFQMLAMTRLPTEKKTQKRAGEEKLDPLVLDAPPQHKKLVLEFRGR